MNIGSWKSRAETAEQEAFHELLAELDRDNQPVNQEQFTRERNRQLTQERERAGFPPWAPLDVCALYFAVTKHQPKTGAESSYEHGLRLLILSPAMRDVWASLELQNVGLLSFVIAVCDASRNIDTPEQGVGTWDRKSRAQRFKDGMSIAQHARQLARELEGTPAEYSSVFRMIPDRYAEFVADHVTNAPVDRFSFRAIDAQDAIGKALPIAGSVPEALEALAKIAEGWANRVSPFGRDDTTIGARAFVVRIAEFLRGSCGNPMPKVVIASCHVLTGVHFDLNQISKLIDA